YRQEHVDRVAMILRGKEAGLSLGDIRAMLDAPSAADRKQVLTRHLETLEERIAQAQTARAMVEHALSCTADDFTRCPNFLRIVASVPEHAPRYSKAGEDEGATGS
ncbi:MAG TPA: MerR family DNA-binding protein, partial [Thermomicrobiales bacterium]|nr:MerR family DNA-binding protein [Thermomicrobiales bacterium]